jgi:hypothetical protein
MARRKNTKRIDPRYFMDEKTDIIKESLDHRTLAEALGDTTPETIADFAWEEGIRLIDFGEPNKEPRLDSEHEKRIAQILADEAEVEIDRWGDAADRSISYDFKVFKDKVVSALWRKHKQAEENGLAT